VHLVIPTGGLGMNTGVGDAFDLAWKLAGTIKGWGGPGLLNRYERERRPIGGRNVEAAGWAAAGTGGVIRRQPPPDARDGPVEAGYSYAGLPLIAAEPSKVAE
jgi:2-polyprenyl-6-methoxyphenol hydroxylase-like FAD-dependent oxidoreductase